MLHRPHPDASPADSVVLSQRDVRELQFAKAAISTGWTLLLEELGLEHARHPAGAAGRVLRQLPLTRGGGPDRPGAQAAGAAHRLGRQRGRRGRQDGTAVASASGPEPLHCSRRWPMSSSPTAPTSTTASSSSSVSRVRAQRARADRLRGAGPAGGGDRLAPRLGGRRTPAATAAAQPAAADRRRGARPGRAAARRGPHGSRSATPTAARTAPSTRSARTWGSTALPGLHCYDVFAGPARLARFFEEQPGTYVLTDFLVRSFDAHRRPRARPRPLPGAARGLLRLLHPRGVAGPGARRRPARRRRAGRRGDRAAAHRRRHRACRARDRARVAGRLTAGRSRRTYRRRLSAMRSTGCPPTSGPSVGRPPRISRR